MLVVGLPAVLLAAAVMLPASAATDVIEFSTIQYDPPGKDNPSNVRLNGEYVTITNSGSAVADLDGWTLQDAAGQVFTFPRHLVYPGGTVYVHTGRGLNGRPDAAHLYWKSGRYIWDNDGDTATLRSASGRVYDSCTWARAGTGMISCGVVPAPPAPSLPVTTAPTVVTTTATPSPPPPLPSNEPSSPPSVPSDEPSPPPSFPPDEPPPPSTITQSATVTTPPPPATSPPSTPRPPTLSPDPADTAGGGVLPPPPLP
jgi:Lamin Tail Domain